MSYPKKSSFKVFQFVLTLLLDGAFSALGIYGLVEEEKIFQIVGAAGAILTTLNIFRLILGYDLVNNRSNINH